MATMYDIVNTAIHLDQKLCAIKRLEAELEQAETAADDLTETLTLLIAKNPTASLELRESQLTLSSHVIAISPALNVTVLPKYQQIGISALEDMAQDEKTQLKP